MLKLVLNNQNQFLLKHDFPEEFYTNEISFISGY